MGCGNAFATHSRPTPLTAGISQHQNKPEALPYLCACTALNISEADAFTDVVAGNGGRVAAVAIVWVVAVDAPVAIVVAPGVEEELRRPGECCRELGGEIPSAVNKEGLACAEECSMMGVAGAVPDADVHCCGGERGVGLVLPGELALEAEVLFPPLRKMLNPTETFTIFADSRCKFMTR
jgi:hypothetical protein